MARTVAVLLSTYNGEKYLPIQLDTILNQRDAEVTLVVRDDGSSDGTVGILDQYEKRHDNMLFIRDGERLGVGRSFISLLKAAPDTDYYAYSDQDDIWHEDKMKVALDTIRATGEDIPTLYCCNQNCVNGSGEFQYVRFQEEAMKSSLIQTVFNNYFAGCTMVLNKALKNEIIKGLPEDSFFTVRIHDAWTACVAYATGKVIFDKDSHMDFRRHETAYSDEFAPGKKVSKLQTYRRKLQRYKKRGLIKNSVKETAKNILRSYASSIDGNEQDELKMICGYDNNLLSKIRFINSNTFRSNIKGTKSTAIYKVLTGVF